MAAAMGPEGLFIQEVRHKTEGPYLTVMGVPAELEIDSGLLGLLQVIGLMVKQDGKKAVGWGEG